MARRYFLDWEYKLIRVIVVLAALVRDLNDEYSLGFIGKQPVQDYLPG